MPATIRPLFEQIDTWLQEIDSEKSSKSAATKAKPATKKATTGAGQSSHISENVDNMTQDAETGDRFRENTEDVSRDVPGTSVDETDIGGGGSQDDKQYNIGTNQSATGEDPSVETASVKGTKEDAKEGDRGGTTHPANAEEVGDKYASMKLSELLKVAEKKATELLTDIHQTAISNQNTSQPVKTAATTTTTQHPAKPAATQAAPTQSAAAGYNLAALLGQTDNDIEKMASDFIEQVIKDAEIDSDLVGSYMTNYINTNRTLAKKAEGYDEEDENNNDDEEKPERTEDRAEEPRPEEGMPPAGGDADVLAALGGGGAPPMPPEAMAGMMPPEAMGGAMPPGGPGGGAMSEEEAMANLAMALDELGVDPATLAQLAGEQGAKIASAVSGFKRAGKFRYREAKTASQLHQREQIKDYIRELIGAK